MSQSRRVGDQYIYLMNYFVSVRYVKAAELTLILLILNIYFYIVGYYDRLTLPDSHSSRATMVSRFKVLVFVNNIPVFPTSRLV